MAPTDEEKEELIEQGQVEGFNLALNAVLNLLEGKTVTRVPMADDKVQRIKVLIEELIK
jgi:hypothetical protein